MRPGQRERNAHPRGDQAHDGVGVGRFLHHPWRKSRLEGQSRGGVPEVRADGCREGHKGLVGEILQGHRPSRRQGVVLRQGNQDAFIGAHARPDIFVPDRKVGEPDVDGAGGNLGRRQAAVHQRLQLQLDARFSSPYG